MKEINRDANLRLAINNIDQAIKELFEIHDNETLAIMSDLADCIWKLREIRNHS
jgi:hypothetical protein